MYYHLVSLSMDPINLVKEFHEEAEKTWICVGCKTLKKEIKNIDIYIIYMPKNYGLNIVLEVGLGVIKKGFIRIIM